ncbi:hypothetical protein NIES22_61510 [Calothrix brevissima NIES-22]|nr:hypothetical protein NIES22_61510 [Calothrix brevissima NIES-22]
MLSISWKNSSKLANYQLWLAWSIALFIVFIVHLSTITISPPAWNDEVQIIEYGRLTLEPHTDWSINWSVAAQRPVFLYSYLGVTLQELAFRASNLSIFGPRLTSVIGGMIAATALLVWLLSRKTPKAISWLLALTFLLEPMFVQSYRGARIDCWAFAFCFGCCWLLRLAFNKFQNAQKFTWLVFLAGSVAAANMFVWPSAVLLYPLVLLEFAELIWQVQIVSKNWKITLWQIIAFVIGGIITACLLTIPIWQQFTMSLSDLQVMASGDRTLRNRANFLAELKSNLNDVIITYKINPLLPIIALVGMFYSRNKTLNLTLIFMGALLTSSKFYTFRAIYLLPYIIYMIVGIYKSFESKHKKNHLRVVYSIVIILLTWSIVLSLIVRPVLALSQKESRDPIILHNAGVAMINDTSHKVYVNAIELYYAGRELGWKMFFPFDLQNEQREKNISAASDMKLRQFIAGIDDAVTAQYNISSEMIQRMESMGFKLQKTFTDSQNKNISSEKKEQKALKSESRPYGPYKLYTR